VIGEKKHRQIKLRDNHQRNRNNIFKTWPSI
jgi:hypothetical protein